MMGMPNPIQFAQMMMQQNPDAANSPRAQEMLKILMSGDAKRGEEYANNLLKSYGMTRDQAMQQAQSEIPRRMKGFGFR